LGIVCAWGATPAEALDIDDSAQAAAANVSKLDLEGMEIKRWAERVRASAVYIRTDR
jgi:hypothetical protein